VELERVEAKAHNTGVFWHDFRASHGVGSREPADPRGERDRTRQQTGVRMRSADPHSASSADTHHNDLAAGKRVLTLAADAIAALGETLNGEFSRAVDVILAVQGRVIVSGMGKSGHIARKIAATLASTGTPAYFIHPAEASHGDLGMVTRDDAL